MKIKTTVHVFYQKCVWEEKGEYQVFACKLDDTDYRTYVSTQEIEIDVPADYDPRAQQIAVLEAKKKEAMAAYQKTVTDIQNRINNLMAIDHS